MMSPAETRECRDKQDALAVELEKVFGPVASVEIILGYRGDIIARKDEDGPVRVYARFKTIKLDPYTTRTPPPFYAYGHCPLSAIEAAHREIARRVLEETEAA